jgi:hypothetical protein
MFRFLSDLGKGMSTPFHMFLGGKVVVAPENLSTSFGEFPEAKNCVAKTWLFKAKLPA